MDLVVGARKVIVAMEHCARGKVKLLKHCTLPLTAARQVNLVITELGVIEIIDERMHLIEIAPDTSIEEIQALTEAELIISPNLKPM
ncbi:sugar phosphate isomerase family [Dongshaea marina]|uniref:hypothetical protein n=1 Tax=Dongshaea marina TaxID=2047966 RepID=UPI002D770C76|nr:hypothetical protein [Dongshaea marina]